MQPRTTAASSNADNIHAILGRFEAWSGKQGTNTLGTKQKGFKEISYEQALGSSRFRRTASVPPKKSLDLTPENVAADAPSSAPAGPKPSPRGSRKKGVHARATPPQEPSEPSAAGQVTFREVLKRSAAAPAAQLSREELSLPALAKTSAAVPTACGGRAVMLSVRTSPAEQALIRARAEEANLSISTYMRQCALEVEQLRRQVETALARMERQAASTAASPPSLAAPAAEGLLVRIARKLFGVARAG